MPLGYQLEFCDRMPKPWNPTLPLSSGPRGSFKNAQALADVFLHEVGRCLRFKHTKRGHTIERQHHRWIARSFSRKAIPFKHPKAQPN